MLYTIVDLMDVFPFDYSTLDIQCENIPYGFIEKTNLPSGQCVSRMITTDLRQYLPKPKNILSQRK